MQSKLCIYGFLLLALAFTIIHTNSYSQSAGIEFRMGYAHTSMADLSKALTFHKESSGIPYIMIEDYEANRYYGGNFVVSVGKFETGVDYQYMRTLGHLNFNDNSIQSSYKQSLAAHALGIFGRYPIIYSKIFLLKVGTSVSVYASKATITESTIYPNVVQGSDASFRSKSFTVTPFLEPVFHITGGLYVGARIGYCYDTKGALHLRDDNRGFYVTADGDKIYTDWTGLRAEGLIGLRMNHQ